ncbi:unnamed protein product [Arctogadus glacialis]
MVISMALPEQQCSLVDAYENCRALADAKACCDYACTWASPGGGPRCAARWRPWTRSSTRPCKTCKDIGAIARVHAENGELVAEGAKEALDLGISGPEGIEISRPEELESEATHRAITVANRAHCPIYMVNVSSMSAGDMIAAAKMQGKVVHAETTVAHAVLSGMQYYHQDWAHAAAHVVVPPLRLDPNTPTTSWPAGQEHRPFCTKQRALGKEDFTKIPHGLAGVQDRMSVLWERGVVAGKMDENRFVALPAPTQAKIYNIYPRKGRIVAGADADVVVVGPPETTSYSMVMTISVSTQVQGGDFNLYEGMRCHGVPLFFPMRTFPDFLYKKMVQREKSQVLKGVDRDPYSGDVAKVATIMKKGAGPGAHGREAPSKSGGGPRGNQAGRTSTSPPSASQAPRWTTISLRGPLPVSWPLPVGRSSGICLLSGGTEKEGGQNHRSASGGVLQPTSKPWNCIEHAHARLWALDKVSRNLLSPTVKLSSNGVAYHRKQRDVVTPQSLARCDGGLR